MLLWFWCGSVSPASLPAVQAVVLGHGSGQDPVGDQSSTDRRRAEDSSEQRRHQGGQEQQEQQRRRRPELDHHVSYRLCDPKRPGDCPDKTRIPESAPSALISPHVAEVGHLVFSPLPASHLFRRHSEVTWLFQGHTIRWLSAPEKKMLKSDRLAKRFCSGSD